MHTPHVVVVGGGFGGLATVRALAGAPVRLTLIDKRNHHLFQPLLYQVASAALAPSDIAAPLRGVLARQANVEVLLAEVTGIDLGARAVHTPDRTLTYDHLVLATGARTAWFGHDDWEAHATGLKTVGDALQVRHRMLGALERAEWTPDPEERARLCTFVVIGGGATGVELAGALREIATKTLTTDFHHVRPGDVRVILVEGTPAVLPPFPADLQASARAQLEALGVEVLTGTMVKALRAGEVDLGDQTLEASTIVWAAGVRPVILPGLGDLPSDRAGRLVVGSDLSPDGHPEVHVVGDLAHVDQADGSTVPGVAPAAQQMGRHVARAILDDLGGRPRSPFRYADKGSLATIGRSKAVADLGPLHFGGFLAWILWAVVHLFTLVGYRNRAVVFVKWAWQWATLDGSSRLLWIDEAARDGVPMTTEAGTPPPVV